MKLRILIGAALGAIVLLVPSPASAKGPTEVELTGPGLDEPIVLDRAGQDENTGAELISATGLYEAFSYPARTALTAERPTTALGSRYVAVYRAFVPEDMAEGLNVRQELYPFADGGPVVFTPPGQSMYGTQTTDGGWARADPSLADLLVSLGVPTPQELDARRASPVEAGSRGVPLLAGFSGVAVLAAAAGLIVTGVVRRGTRRTTAPSGS